VTSDKKTLFISESEGSYLDVVSTAYRPNIKIIYNKLLKETKNLPDNEVNITDFIDVKGMKAQGNQLTKLKVKEVVLTHSIEGEEDPWPEDVEAAVEVDDSGDSVADEDVENQSDTTNDSDSGNTIEWDFTKNDEEDQMTLF
jgi:topoisomerase-4 subunit A